MALSDPSTHIRCGAAVHPAMLEDADGDKLAKPIAFYPSIGEPADVVKHIAGVIERKPFAKDCDYHLYASVYDVVVGLLTAVTTVGPLRALTWRTQRTRSSLTTFIRGWPSTLLGSICRLVSVVELCSRMKRLIALDKRCCVSAFPRPIIRILPPSSVILPPGFRFTCTARA